MSKKIKSLIIPPSKKCIGLHSFCSICNTSYSDSCKSHNVSILQCPHPEAHYFKGIAHVAGTKNGRKTIKLKTRNVDEAAFEVMSFRQKVKNGEFKTKDSSEKHSVQEVKNEIQNRPTLLIHALGRYIGFLRNENVPEHMIRERNPQYISEVERSLAIVVEGLKRPGRDVTSLTIDDLNDSLIGEIYSFLDNKNYSNRQFNKVCIQLSSWLNWYKEEYDYPIRNWFSRIKKESSFTTLNQFHKRII